jgi:hypothetical protein
MNPRLLKAGHFWRSNDPADIIVGESSVTDVVCIPPSFIDVMDINRLVPAATALRLKNLEFLVAGLFGPSRPSGDKLWNGGAHRYGVYIHTDSLGGENIVILSNTPDGTRGVILPRSATEAWKSVFYGMKSSQVWDICWTMKLIHDSQLTQLEAAEKEVSGAKASNKAHGVRHRTHTHPTSNPQGVQGLQHKEAVRHGGAGVDGNPPYPAQEGRHEPVASLASV